METSGNTLITSAPRSEGDVLNTPDPQRWWARALLCGAFFKVILGRAQQHRSPDRRSARRRQRLDGRRLPLRRKALQELLEAVPVHPERLGADSATSHREVQGEGR